MFDLSFKEPSSGDDDTWWNLHVDGAVNRDEARVHIVLISPLGNRLVSAIHLGFSTINNDAEYKVLIGGLSLPLEMKVRNVIVLARI